MRDGLIDLIDGFRELDAPQDGRSWTEHLADHLLANGVIVPPVKVDQNVWYFSTIKDKRILPFVNRAKITKIEITSKSVKFYFAENKYFALSEFGKTVFATKEEAERALAERKDGHWHD